MAAVLLPVLVLVLVLLLLLLMVVVLLLVLVLLLLLPLLFLRPAHRPATTQHCVCRLLGGAGSTRPAPAATTTPARRSASGAQRTSRWSSSPTSQRTLRRSARYA